MSTSAVPRIGCHFGVCVVLRAPLSCSFWSACHFCPAIGSQCTTNMALTSMVLTLWPPFTAWVPLLHQPHCHPALQATDDQMVELVEIEGVGTCWLPWAPGHAEPLAMLRPPLAMLRPPLAAASLFGCMVHFCLMFPGLGFFELKTSPADKKGNSLSVPWDAPASCDTPAASPNTTQTACFHPSAQDLVHLLCLVHCVQDAAGLCLLHIAPRQAGPQEGAPGCAPLCMRGQTCATQPSQVTAAYDTAAHHTGSTGYTTQGMYIVHTTKGMYIVHTTYHRIPLCQHLPHAMQCAALATCLAICSTCQPCNVPTWFSPEWLHRGACSRAPQELAG